MTRNLIKLLLKNVSVLQLISYILAALTGMSILVAGFGFSHDISSLFSPDKGKSLFRNELLVVNKIVPSASVFGQENSFFSESEIEELRNRDFVHSLAYFNSSRFGVSAYIQMSGSKGGLSTEMFFESVPDKFLDVKDPKWHWNEGDVIIPVLIPRDYLALYNFGFAGAQQLPQISEDVLKQIIFNLQLTGNGYQDVFSGRIVGFSDEINTILVPENFLQWANKHYGDNRTKENVSRLLLEVSNPAATEITEFFGDHPGYFVNSHKAETGRLSYFLKILIAALMVIGVLIILPSIGLILLSINLIIYKTETTISNLLLIGYPRRSIAGVYNWLITLLNIIVVVFSLAIAWFLRGLYLPKLTLLGIVPDAVTFVLPVMFALGFTGVLIAIDIFWIRRQIKNIKVPVRA